MTQILNILDYSWCPKIWFNRAFPKRLSSNLASSSKLLVLLAHSKSSLLDVWEVSIFKTVPNCQQLLTTIFCFYSHANRNLFPGNSDTAVELCQRECASVCVFLFHVLLGWFWVIQIPPKALIPPLVDLASFISSVFILKWLGHHWVFWDNSSFMRFCFFALGFLQLITNLLQREMMHSRSIILNAW